MMRIRKIITLMLCVTGLVQGTAGLARSTTSRSLQGSSAGDVDRTIRLEIVIKAPAEKV